MQTARIVQAVVLLLIVAMAASCTASKEYTSKLFAPRNPAAQPRDSQVMALRFLELDQVEPNQEDWVSTDIIMGRDTSTGTTALDNFSRLFPAKTVVAVKTDSLNADKDKETTEVKADPIMAETKMTEEPVARSYNSGEVRTKKTRTEK